MNQTVSAVLTYEACKFSSYEHPSPRWYALTLQACFRYHTQKLESFIKAIQGYRADRARHISATATPLRAELCFAFHTGLAVRAGSPNKASGAATSFTGSGTHSLILLHANLPWQSPRQLMVPLHLSFLIHKSRGSTQHL